MPFCLLRRLDNVVFMDCLPQDIFREDDTPSVREMPRLEVTIYYLDSIWNGALETLGLWEARVMDQGLFPGYLVYTVSTMMRVGPSIARLPRRITSTERPGCEK